jgi:threonyl-tRNA synthetase
MNNLDHLRHSTSHLLAAAVLDLWPNTKPTIGPSIENGFYYDFDFGKIKITEDDLPKIEARMGEIVKNWEKFAKIDRNAKDAKKHFKDNPYKLELIEEFVDSGDNITFYQSGNFVDLCRGGHIDNPKDKLKYFRLLSIAGAYWRGSEKNKMLTRIYGTAFPTKKELDKYLVDLEEAEKRNHRKIGKEMELFAIFPEIGQGLPVWLPNGFAVRRVLEDYMYKLERRYGYKHVLTPHINKKDLYEISGHLGFYKDSMYPPLKSDEEEFYLKPMNCPGAMLIFAMKPRSYKELPIKLGEMGTVYRYEKPGELQGLQRVRGFTQNDAHIFTTKEQMYEDLQEVMEMMKIFYKDLGFSKHKYILATSDPEKEKYKFCGTKSGWKWAEDLLRRLLKENNLDFEEQKGEAAFYGPKIDVLAVNVFGKADAISTNQVDFNLPERFRLAFTNKAGVKEQPYVVHRALVGSFERFFSFLIEYYAGAFPVWFAPEQAVILPLSDKFIPYAKKVAEKLKDHDIRHHIDERSETLSAKIRDAQISKVPYILVVGGKEEENGTVAVRLRTKEDLGEQELDSFIKMITTIIESKSLSLTLD